MSAQQLQADCEALHGALLMHPEGLTAKYLTESGWDKDRLRSAAGALKQAVCHYLRVPLAFL
jgi:hypothetical protein